jgi:serine/threonine protein kinase
VLEEMRVLTRTNNPYFIKAYFAFQDTHSLYLVTEAIDSLEFTHLIGKRFTEPEAKYVIFALLSIIE